MAGCKVQGSSTGLQDVSPRWTSTQRLEIQMGGLLLYGDYGRIKVETAQGGM